MAQTMEQLQNTINMLELENKELQHLNWDRIKEISVLETDNKYKEEELESLYKDDKKQTEEIKKLKEKVKSYEDNVEEVGMTIIENLSKELGIKEETIMSCEKLCASRMKDLKLHKFMFEDLLKEYIKVSQSSDNPIYEESLVLMRDACISMGDEEQQYLIELIKRRIDNMNSNDWNEDGRVCKLTLTESHRLPSNYVNDRFMVYIMTDVEEEEELTSEEESSDDDSDDDSDVCADFLANYTPQGNHD